MGEGNELIEYRLDRLDEFRAKTELIISENQRKIEIMENIIDEIKAQRADDKKWKRQILLSVVGGIIVIILSNIILNYLK